MRQANEGQHTKMGMVYQYLTGPRFRAHIEAIFEEFTEMEDDFNKERITVPKTRNLVPVREEGIAF